MSFEDYDVNDLNLLAEEIALRETEEDLLNTEVNVIWPN